MIVLIAASATGCAAPGYDAGALERHLESTGVSRSAAQCVVRRMADLGEQRLGAHAEPIAKEVAAERKILRECKVKV